MQSTQSERFTDTAQFNHKSITQPTITYANKVMARIVDCAKAIKGIGNSNGAKESQQLLHLTEAVVQQELTIVTRILPTVAPWVNPTHSDDNCRQIRSMKKQTKQVPRCPHEQF